MTRTLILCVNNVNFVLSWLVPEDCSVVSVCSNKGCLVSTDPSLSYNALVAGESVSTTHIAMLTGTVTNELTGLDAPLKNGETLYASVSGSATIVNVVLEFPDLTIPSGGSIDANG